MRTSRLILALAFFAVQAICAGETIRFQADSVARERVSGRETTILSGSARVETDRILVSADKIALSGQGNRYFEAEGTVSLYDKERNISLTMQRLEYDRTLDLLKMSGSVELEDHDNRVFARAARMEFRGQENLVLLQISVRIFKNEIAARAELAIYNRENSSLELSGQPIVYNGSDRFAASRISVDLESEDIQMAGRVEGLITYE